MSLWSYKRVSLQGTTVPLWTPDKQFICLPCTWRPGRVNFFDTFVQVQHHYQVVHGQEALENSWQR